MSFLRRASVVSDALDDPDAGALPGMRTFERRASTVAAATSNNNSLRPLQDRRRSVAASQPPESSESGFYGHFAADGVSLDFDDDASSRVPDSCVSIPRLDFGDGSDEELHDSTLVPSASLDPASAPMPARSSKTRRVVPSNSCYAGVAASPAASRAPSRNRGSYGTVSFDTVASPVNGGLELSTTDVAIKTMSARGLEDDAGAPNQHYDAASAEVAFADRVVHVLGTAPAAAELLRSAASVAVQQPSGDLQQRAVLPLRAHTTTSPPANMDARAPAAPRLCVGPAPAAAAATSRSCWRHLAQLHSAELDEGERRCTVVYEALHGGTLADAVAARGGGGGGGGRGLPAAGLRTVARDVLRGLQALHGTFRAVHNDLKLDNAMLTTPAAAACVAHGCSCPGDSDECPHAPHVKLIDFGCAALMPLLSVEAVASGSGSARVDDDDEAYAFSQRGALGTMAPERLRGDGYGPKADVWALGAMLLHAARGRHPFLSPPAAVVARSPAAGAPGTARFWRLAAVLQFTAGMPEREAATRDAVTAALNDRAPFSRDADEEEQFRSFVRFALQADPARRASVAELLAHPWLAPPQPHRWIGPTTITAISAAMPHGPE